MIPSPDVNAPEASLLENPTSCVTIEAEVGAELYGEILSEFLTLLPSQVADLRQAVASGDLEGARSIGHQLKGTAPSFGAAQLNRLANGLLQWDPEQDMTLESLIETIDQEVNRLQSTQDA